MDAAEIDTKLALATDEQIALLIEHRNNPQPPADVPLMLANFGLSGTFNYWGSNAAAVSYVMDNELRERLGEMAKDHRPAHRRAS